MNRFSFRQATRSTSLRSLLPNLAIALVSVALSARAEVLTHYRFDNDLLDSATAGIRADNMSAFGGTAAFAPGVIGSAVQLDDSTAGRAFSLRADSSADLNLGVNWSLEAYVKPDIANSGYWDRFWTKWGGPIEWHWAFTHENDGLDFFVNDPATSDFQDNPLPGDVGPLNSVPQGQWSHVALVGNSATQSFKGYINGREVVSGAYSVIPATDRPMAFGTFDNNRDSFTFTGLVDDAKIHNVAVTTDYLLARAAVLPTYPRFLQTKAWAADSEVAFPVSSSDLLPTASLTVNGFSGAGHPARLTDGSAGTQGQTTTASDSDGRWSAIYRLDLSNAADGYSLTQIDTFAGSQGFAYQRYAVSISKVGDEEFQQVGSVVYTYPSGNFSQQSSTKISLRGENQFVASNVDAIRFDFVDVDSAASYREIDVSGVPTIVPEPSAILTLGLGLVGLIVIGKRSCR